MATRTLAARTLPLTQLDLDHRGFGYRPKPVAADRMYHLARLIDKPLERFDVIEQGLQNQMHEFVRSAKLAPCESHGQRSSASIRPPPQAPANTAAARPSNVRLPPIPYRSPESLRAAALISTASSLMNVATAAFSCRPTKEKPRSCVAPRPVSISSSRTCPESRSFIPTDSAYEPKFLSA